MAITCPRCLKHPLKVEQKSGVYAGGGAVGFMLMRAFSGKHACPDCGTIPLSDFSPETRQGIILRKAGLVFGSLVLLVALVAFLIWMAN